MFYFKDEPLAPSQMDPEQLRQIKRFRARLSGLGGLSWNFNTVEEFQNLVRVHLSRLVQDWARPSVTTTLTTSTVPPSEVPPKADDQSAGEMQQEEDEEGLLDLVDQANDAFAKLTELAGRMTAAIGEIGEKMAQRTKEIRNLHPERGSYDVKAAKKIAARAAVDLTEYVARTEVDIPIFAEALATAMGSLGRAASISMEFDRRNTEDLEGLLENARSLRHVLTESRAALESFRALSWGSQAEEAEALPKGVAVNPKEAGGLELIPSRGLQDEGEERALHAVHHRSVELVLIPGEEIPHKAGESLGHELVEADNAALQSAPPPVGSLGFSPAECHGSARRRRAYRAEPMAVTASRDGR